MRTQDVAVVKDGTNEANSTEDARPPAGDVQPRDREGLTSPMELWSSMVLEETPYEVDVHRNPESIRTDMESTSGSAEGAGEGSMVQEGANTAQDAKGTEIDTEDGGKILDQSIYNHDDNCTRMGEDEYSHEEKKEYYTPTA